MTANNDAARALNEYADLQDMASTSSDTFPVSLNGAYSSESLRNMARALSADRGEAVAWQKAGPETDGRWVESDKNDAIYWRTRSGWKVRELYAATPPSPAESAEGFEPLLGDETDGEVIEHFIRVCREMKPVGQWPGERVCLAIERLFNGRGEFAFIAPEDASQYRKPSSRGKDEEQSLPPFRRLATAKPSLAACRANEARYLWLRDDASRAQTEMFADRRGTRLAADRLCDAGIDIARAAIDSLRQEAPHA